MGRKPGNKYTRLEKLGYKFKSCEIADSQSIVFRPIAKNHLTNGILLELDQLRKQCGLALRYLLKWLFQFLSIKDELSDNNIRKLNFGLRQLYKEKKEVSKIKNRKLKEEKETFFEKPFDSYPNIINEKSRQATVTSEKDLLQKLESAFNNVTIQTKETKEENRKLKIEKVQQEKLLEILKQS